MTNNTIYALASPAGKGGIAVIRVSGSEALASLELLSGVAAARFTPRMMRRVVLRHPVSRETIDDAMAVYFKSPASFTGEDVVEYYLHGGMAVVRSLLSSLSGQKNHRMAEPGEFTRRAFENGKIDLTAAEAVADLIDAETSLQQSQALAQLGGSLSALYEDWTAQLKTHLAHIEADIEFPDEDMPESIAPAIMSALAILRDDIKAHLNDGRRGERLRDGVHIAVIGAPNAGKSSLVNALAQRDVAIVSDMAGTTRDIIEVHLDLGGYPVILSDTAGLRPEQLGDSGQDKVESEGIRRALERAEQADLKILLFDGSLLPERDAATLAVYDNKSIIVYNKSDTIVSRESLQDGLCVSAHTGQGFKELLEHISMQIETMIGRRDTPSLTRERHRAALEETLLCLERAQTAFLPELSAEDIRLAVRALGRITGKVHVEELLDVIFSDFCIGK